MKTIESVEDQNIFVKTSPFTNLIKGKGIRKELYDNNIKIEIKKERFPVTEALGQVFTSSNIVFYITHPRSIDKDVLNEIVHQLSSVIYRRYDHGQIYSYIEFE